MAPWSMGPRQTTAPLGGTLPRSPGEVLPLFEALVTDPAQQAARVRDSVEPIGPTGQVSFMSPAANTTLNTPLGLAGALRSPTPPPHGDLHP